METLHQRSNNVFSFRSLTQHVTQCLCFFHNFLSYPSLPSPQQLYQIQIHRFLYYLPIVVRVSSKSLKHHTNCEVDDTCV